MRPVDKGHPSRTYANYQDARDDLCSTIGWYCSYCEMKVNHVPHVEHVIPQHNGGPVTDWDNFLVSCIHCNSVKNDRNFGRKGYFWPDRDNTARAFKYVMGRPIEPGDNLRDRQKRNAQSIIDLCGLNREPGSQNPPTQKDVRWRFRLEAWQAALRSLLAWQSAPGQHMLEAIVSQAIGYGFFSVWMTVFNNEPAVRRELINRFPGTHVSSYDQQTNLIRRSAIL